MNRTKYLYRKSINGVTYVYFRVTGRKPVALPRDERSPEFARAYDNCLREYNGGNKAMPRSWPIKPPSQTLNDGVGFLNNSVGRVKA